MVLLRIVLVSLVLIVGFAGYTMWGIPLIVPEPPPVEEKLTGEITMDQFIALGRKIYDGKGTCTLCHNPVGGRAPVLDTAGQVANERIAEAEYKGPSKSGEEYLRESMIDTSVYVVPGFGKPGTNDTVSPMPDVSKGAIGLSDVEIDAVIAYLQSNSGVDVTVALPSGDGAGVAAEEDEASAEISVAATPEEAFEKFECATCHIAAIYPDGGDLGPDLTDMPTLAATRVAGMEAEAYLLESIIKPNVFITPDFDEGMMPEDYGERMTVAELYLIVDALLGKAPAGE